MGPDLSGQVHAPVGPDLSGQVHTPVGPDLSGQGIEVITITQNMRANACMEKPGHDQLLGCDAARLEASFSGILMASELPLLNTRVSIGHHSVSVYILPVRALHDQHDKFLAPDLVYDPIPALADPIALLRG